MQQIDRLVIFYGFLSCCLSICCPVKFLAFKISPRADPKFLEMAPLFLVNRLA